MRQRGGAIPHFRNSHIPATRGSVWPEWGAFASPDASVMPNVVGGNTNAASTMIGEKGV